MRRGGALATVGKRHLDEVVSGPGLPPAPRERGRRLIGGVRAAQLVGGDDDPHPRRTVSRGALGSILGIAGDDYIWEPTAETLEHARATAFMREHGIADWRELIRRSQDDVEWFWDAAVRFLGLEFFKPYDRVLDTSRGIAWATWFTGGTVNLTHNCVDRHPAEQPAVVWESEDGQVVRATYGELAAETNRLANALLELGVGRGDAVGLFLPMSIRPSPPSTRCARSGRSSSPSSRGSPRPRSRPAWPTPAPSRFSRPTRCRDAGGPSR